MSFVCFVGNIFFGSATSQCWSRLCPTVERQYPDLSGDRATKRFSVGGTAASGNYYSDATVMPVAALPQHCARCLCQNLTALRLGKAQEIITCESASLIESVLRRWPFVARCAYDGVRDLRIHAVELDLKVARVARLMKSQLICQRRDGRASGILKFRDCRE